jgi:hypothetical protein
MSRKAATELAIVPVLPGRGGPEPPTDSPPTVLASRWMALFYGDHSRSGSTTKNTQPSCLNGKGLRPHCGPVISSWRRRCAPIRQLDQHEDPSRGVDRGVKRATARALFRICGGQIILVPPKPVPNTDASAPARCHPLSG